MPTTVIRGRRVDLQDPGPPAIVDYRATILAAVPAELQAIVTRLCDAAPLVGLTIGDPTAPTTWSLAFDTHVTDAQRTAARAVLEEETPHD